MKTKLFCLVLMLSLSASIAIAQRSENKKISIALLGGINFQNLNGKDYDDKKLENDMILGFHGGVNVQILIAPEFYFQPGLVFSTKGAKNTDDPITSTYKLSYLELPLNVVYKGQLGAGYILVGFGPYIGYGIGGKSIIEGGSVKVESDIEFKNVVEAGDPLTVVYIKRFDAGGNIFAGYEMANGIFAQFNAQLGMLKINPEDKRFPDDKSSVKNTGFGLSVGYRF